MMEHQRWYSSRTQLLLGGLLTIAIFLFLPCFQPEGHGKIYQKKKTPPVRPEMIVSTVWLAAHLNDPKVVILHVARTRTHYDEGHIPGARFVGWGEITTTRDGVPNELASVADLQELFARLGVGDDARIVLYGDNSGLSAARAYFTLDYLGHGGRADAVTNFDVVRDLSWTAANVPSPSVVLIDARPVDDYTGTIPGEGVPRGGHIPGAASVFWMQNLASKENPTLRSAAELRKLYEEAGVQHGRTIVTYCRTGAQASHSYFVLKHLGYDVVMYDGSFFECSHRQGAPVVAGRERK